MNLFNKKLLAQGIARYEFPKSDEVEKLQSHLIKLQAFIKDEDLNRTQEIKVQGAFLVRVFSDVLGYTNQLDDNNNWSLEQHPKTEIDSQVADGGLGIFSKEGKQYIAVIELKDAKTSLDKKQSSRVGKLTPVEQAFQYLNKFDGCKWAIVSNFREIRIYSKSRGQGYYEKFDIVNLTQEQEFKRFYYILNKSNLVEDGNTSAIDTLVQDTTAQEEDITKKFYGQYKEIRLKVLNHLFENNPEIDRLILVEKTQKLLDRLIFTMVCEDSRTLLPAHLVKNTYERTFQSFALSDSDQRVWVEFKGLFQAIDKGNKRVAPPINAYNGGLFKADEILDNLVIKDEIWKEVMRLTNYDFESDLSVNVLGHIFEQSISDLEEIKASVQGESVDKKKSLRKKQGIFYTPEFVTKFIVENTAGRYLEENPEKLDSIKILDPACGSGAFLNQTHSFLLNQYKLKDEETQLEHQKKDKVTPWYELSWVENDKGILLNNLFGVDLSPESVEITKLALWLKTAKSTEPLQNLDNNIKCGNSLIDDSQIAGSRAFNWSEEYKEIIENGGFDVILGNPPYVNAKNSNFSEDEKLFFNHNYKSASYQLDTYILFIEKGLDLLKTGGYIGFIIPNTWLGNIYLSKIRELILKTSLVTNIVEMSAPVFEDANVDTLIFIAKKQELFDANEIEIGSFSSGNYSIKHTIKQDVFLENENYIFDVNQDPSSRKLVSKIEECAVKLSDISRVNRGVHAYRKDGYGISKFQDGFQTEKDYDEKSYHSVSRIDNTFYPEVRGNNLQRYVFEHSDNYVSWGSWLAEPREWDYFTGERIYLRKIVGSTLFACYVDDENVADQSVYIAKINDPSFLTKYIVGILNSRLIAWYFRNKNNEFDALFPQIKVTQFKGLPIAKVKKEQQSKLSEMTGEMVKLSKVFKDSSANVLELLSAKYGLSISPRLKNFFNLGINDLLEELLKQKIKLTIDEQEELQKWFNVKREKVKDLDNKVHELDRKIDREVYNLYGLTAEEIAIVEKPTIL